MDFSSFEESLSLKEPLANLSVYLKALWYDANDDWEKAHVTIQNVHDKNAAWIHAYLHRKEGDISNADYWYARAGKKRTDSTVVKEWDEIVSSLL